MLKGHITDSMSVLIVDILEEVNVEHHDGYLSVRASYDLDCIVEFGFDPSVVEYIGKSILQCQLLVFFQGGHQLYGIFVDVLYHEHVPEVFSGIGGLGTGEGELDPDELSFKVLHQAVKRRSTSGHDGLFEIIGIRSFEEKLLVIGPDHVNDHHSPVGVFEACLHGLVGNLGDAYAGCGILGEIDVHGEQICVLYCGDLLVGKEIPHVLARIKLLEYHDVDLLIDRIHGHLHGMRSLIFKDGNSLAVFSGKFTESRYEYLVILGYGFLFIIQMEPELLNQFIVASGLFDKILENAASEQGSVGICLRVDDDDRIKTGFDISGYFFDCVFFEFFGHFNIPRSNLKTK